MAQEHLPTFSLDIGTRKVVGLLSAPGPRGLRILAAERDEHRTRSMYDGQVHDVAAVAAVVRRIKERLEQRAGVTLTEAAVAAAGRALRTARGASTHERTPDRPIDGDEAFALELAAIQKAQQSLAAQMRQAAPAPDYLFMGHSVLTRQLDGFPLASLVGHRGATVTVEVIATFLPRGVVDSLQAVLDDVGLEMAALTLEPAAAIHVVIPASMRHLNLVLIDIGAGTSDIAITRHGTVVAYDMVPVAGDEMTEALSAALLLDFPVAEAAKRRLAGGLELEVCDVLGRRRRVPAAEAQAALAPAVAHLAGLLGRRILELNAGPPQAVALIGGGSQTPGIGPALAAALGLAPDRVAVRGRAAVAGVTGARGRLAGPDAVTPIGIAAAALEQRALGFACVQVGGAGVRLFHPSRLRVADALLAAGYAMRDLVARPGPGMTVTVNGQLRLLPGGAGTPARICRDGQPVGLEDPVRHRDALTVTPAVPGAPARARVADAVPDLAPLPLWVNGAPQAAPPVLRINGRPAAASDELADNDIIDARLPATVAEALAGLDLPPAAAPYTFRCRVGGEWRTVSLPRSRITRNGPPVAPDSPVHAGDQLTLAGAPPPTAPEVAAAAGAPGQVVRVACNGRPLALWHGPPLLVDGAPAAAAAPLADGVELVIGPPPDRPPILADAIAQAGVAADPPPGRHRLRLEAGGRPAEFATPLAAGDELVVEWE